MPVGQYVLIAVSDTGAGMSREVQEKAFDPFFTNQAARAGHRPRVEPGLWLRQTVRRTRENLQRGREGTTIKVYLPRAHVAAGYAMPGDAPLVGSLGSETILVVEDEEDVRSYLVETLTDLNYRVREAADGAARARTIRGRPVPDRLAFDRHRSCPD